MLQMAAVADHSQQRGMTRLQELGQKSCVMIPAFTRSSLIRCELESHAKWLCGFEIFAGSSSKTSPCQWSHGIRAKIYRQ